MSLDLKPLALACFIVLSGNKEYIDYLKEDGNTLEIHRKEILSLTYDYPGMDAGKQLLEGKVNAS